VLLPVLEGTLDGDPAAIRSTFKRVESCCVAYDAAREHNGTRRVIGAWRAQLSLFRE
jgi:hypothetical protein